MHHIISVNIIQYDIIKLFASMFLYPLSLIFKEYNYKQIDTSFD